MLELQLNRVDYLKVLNPNLFYEIEIFFLKTISSVTSKCMRLLSRENVKKDTQKVCISLRKSVGYSFQFSL
jgi:hypothetical protein